MQFTCKFTSLLFLGFNNSFGNGLLTVDFGLQDELFQLQFLVTSLTMAIPAMLP
jgi:hypothetical protein